MHESRKRFFQCYRSIFYSLFAFGCLSFRLNRQHELKISIWTILLTNLFRLIGLGSFVGAWVYKIYSHQYSEAILALSPLLQLLGIFELAVSVITYVNVSISMESKKKQHVELFNKAYELDEVFMEKFKVRFNYNMESRRNIANVVVAVVYCGIYWTTSFIIMDSNWRVVWMAFGYVICTLGALLTSYSHNAMIYYLGSRFKTFGCFFQKYLSLNLNKNKEKQRQFVFLLHHYRKYCELIHAVNDVYEHAAMVNYFHDFTQTSSIVFVLCHMALQSDTSVIKYLFLFIFVLPKMFKIIYMAFCARKTLLELKSCLAIIARFDDNLSSKTAKDLIDELILWSKMNEFQFSIGSALTLNFGLVYEFFFGIANYILILVALKSQESSIKESLVGSLKKQQKD